MLKLAIGTLFIGLLTGCAELPWHDAAQIDLTQRAGGKPQVADAAGWKFPDGVQAVPADIAASQVGQAPALVPVSASGPASSSTDHQQFDPAVTVGAYRSESESPQFPVVLAGTEFDSTSSAGVAVRMSGGATLPSGPVPTFVGTVSSLDGADESKPEVQWLPPVDVQPAGYVSMSGANDQANQPADQNDPSPINADNGSVGAPPHGATAPQEFSELPEHPLMSNLWNDEVNFYRCHSLEWLAVGLGTAAIIANTHIDEGFRDAYGESLRPANTQLDSFKQIGSGQYVIPSLAAIWLLDLGIDSYVDDGGWASTNWLQEWSGRSMRGLIVGAVPLLALQYAIGSSRPSYGVGSGWHPFKANNGVSGHAFVGAVPLWTVAQMTDCCALDVAFYAAGTLAGWARIHTDSHYLSQVLMGWWLAGLSVSAVNHTELEKHQWYTIPTVDDGGVGISLIHLW